MWSFGPPKYRATATPRAKIHLLPCWGQTISGTPPPSWSPLRPFRLASAHPLWDLENSYKPWFNSCSTRICNPNEPFKQTVFRNISTIKTCRTCEFPYKPKTHFVNLVFTFLGPLKQTTPRAWRGAFLRASPRWPSGPAQQEVQFNSIGFRFWIPSKGFSKRFPQRVLYWTFKAYCRHEVAARFA